MSAQRRIETMTKRVVSPGVGPDGRLFITIEATSERLSITGVEGPRANGDARGSSGQCVDALDRLTGLDGGWTLDMVRRLKAEWERWHLNDMRAGCEHQRKAGWETRPIDPSKPLNAYGKHTGGTSDTWNMLAWVSRKEHPEGLLGEPCDVCGYKYGSAWRSEPVPDDVLAFLTSLPENDELPTAWK
jgi:hypothetical protein